MEYEVWIGEGDGAIGWFLITATEAKRQELRRVDPDSMKDLAASFEADSWDSAKAKFEEMREALIEAWEANNPT
jgi:hypothetical protein